jgi:hypothetical protein
MEEQYYDTRIWHCCEAVLLMNKNEIRTNRKLPLPTPEHASVLRAFCLPSRVLLQVARTRRGRNSFYEKRKKKKNFSFSTKEMSTPLALVSILH